MNPMDSPEIGFLPKFIVVISGNVSLVGLIRKAASEKFEVVVHYGDALERDLLRRLQPKIVLLDDAAVGVTDRTWMLRQLKRFVPDAKILYLTADHTPELECRVRAVGVAYYGPLEPARVYAVAKRLCLM
jgi:DNA-binding NarL/FixJ family response regulator